MKFFILLFFAFPTLPAEHHKKVLLSDDVLDRLAEIELVYKSCLEAGMTKENAALYASKWQDTKYPTVLDRVDKKENKDPKKKK